jgi:alkanesulfonate monooxygenase SsuD/methylene tetrahydromethanopterin reductase-like flavin-dependent oxidoreductase (luciferase family)
MREYLAVVRAILAGEPPPEGERWRSNFAFTGFDPRPDIPIYLAGLSPAMLRLAGELADGVLLWACPANYVRDVVLPEVARGRERVGKTLDGFTIAASVPSSADGDRTVALDGIRAELHRYFGLPFYRTMFEAAGYGKDLAAYDAASDRAAQLRAISEELIENLCAIGDPSDVRRGIERYRAAGATNPILTGIAGSDFTATLRAAKAS